MSSTDHLLPFAATAIDRAALLRLDSETLLTLARQGSARFLALHADGVPVAGDTLVWTSADALPEGLLTDGDPFSRLLLLGRDGDALLFAWLTETPGERLLDMRSAAAALRIDETGLVAQARALSNWHASHRFCARCGSPTVAAEGGYTRRCLSATCGVQHFPRTDPVVITVVHHGEYCLLAHAKRFQPGFYSSLAGFVEPGETAEHAVRREVAEEVGVQVGRVTYHMSQPWPFPYSLMLGFHSEAASTDITVDGVEIDDARWFSRAEVRQMLSNEDADGLRTPQPISISHRLIKTWAEGMPG
jgi:NAD+ diphosphatase